MKRVRKRPVSQRDYYYYVSLLGDLYPLTDDRLPERRPFGPTFLRDTKFLDFFFKQLRPRDDEGDATWPWVSPCGRETNYVHAAATPLVYKDLRDGRLLYGGSLSTAFDASRLSLDAAGMLYHAPPPELERLTEPCLIKTHLATEIAQHCDETLGRVSWGGASFPIAKLRS